MEADERGRVGKAGVGELTVSNGAAWTTKKSVIGDLAGSSGTVTIKGAGSSWTEQGTSAIGFEGSGTLSILDGAAVTAGETAIGQQTGGTGVVTVSGAGSSWATTVLTTGLMGSGDLSVLGGAKVTSSEAYLAYGGTGAVRVDGPGSNWTIGNLLYLGYQNGSAGTLTIAGGGSVSVANFVQLTKGAGASAVLNIGAAPGNPAQAPGTLATPQLIFGPGSASLNFNHSGTDLVFAPKMTGAGTLNHYAGTTRLTGNSGGKTGNANVLGGVLLVDGTLGGNVAVQAGGALGGVGQLTGPVAITGGRLLGTSGQTLTLGSLTLDSAATVEAALALSGGQRLFNVTGNLTLDGTLDVSDAGGFGYGIYRLFDYGGALTDNGLEIGMMPAGYATSLQTAVAGQVNLVVSNSDSSIQFWNGTTTAPNGTINGGDGTWTAGSLTNWTDVIGTNAQSWNDQFAVFQGTPGIVTVDGGSGAVLTTGMQFVGQNWIVTGDKLTLAAASGDTIIRVGDGSAGSANHRAIIGSVLTGATGLVKQDLGTLILTGNNSYTGGTTIAAGTLQIGNGGSQGSIAGDVVNDGLLRFARSADLLFMGSITGSGGLEVQSGKVTLAGAASHAGGTSIATGATLRIGAGGTTGSIGGPIANAGTLAFDRSDAWTFGGVLSGGGVLVNAGGTSRLTGDSSGFAGTTSVTGGALVVDGALGGAVSVHAGGSLGGGGQLLGMVDASDGGTLRGVSGQTLMVGSLVLGAGSTVTAGLGQAGAPRLFNVLGDLTLDGTLTVTDTGGFGYGLYRLFDYGGTLTDNGLTLSTMPDGLGGTLQTSIAHQVNLVVTGAGTGTTRFWNGTNTSPNGTVNGGPGVWSADLVTNWTNEAGTVPYFWDGRFAVFQGTPGAVTVDGSAGAVSATGMQFVGQGWSVGGDAIQLGGANGTTTIRVGDGTAAGAAHVATIASELAGNSALLKQDLGTLILTGDNSYTGGTTIAAGTLQIGNGGASGSIQGDVVDNGRLRFARSGATTFAGSISGSGSVDVASGAVTLTGAANHAGGTSVAAGASLRIGDGGTKGSIAGDIALAGTLAFNRSDATSYAGAITGAGSVQVASGSVTLTGASTYGGGTSIASGATLRLGAGGTSGSVAGNIANAGTLAFDRSDSWTYAGILSGAGINRQLGAGVTTLTGNSGGFAGTTRVEAGTLVVNGVLGGTLELLSGGRLQGTGTAAQVTVAGTLAPGNSIGTLNLASLQFAAGSVYEVEANAAGQSDRIVASGTVSIAGGTVRVLAGLGNYAPFTDYDIITAAGGVSGTFSNVTSNLAFLVPALSYDATHVRLRLTRNDLDFSAAGVTPNQRAVGEGVEEQGWGGPLYGVVLNLSQEQAGPSFDQLSGEIHATLRSALVEDSEVVRNAAIRRLQAAGAETEAEPAIWGDVAATRGHRDGDGNAARSGRELAGLLVGIDAFAGEDVRVGAVVGYSGGELDVDARASTANTDSYHVGVYAGGTLGAASVRGGASYSRHEVASRRGVAIPGLSETERARYHAQSVQLFAEGAYRIALRDVEFEPFAGLAWVRLASDGFVEKGGAAAIKALDANDDVAFGTLGARARGRVKLGEVAAEPQVSLAWRHAFSNISAERLSFASGGADMRITGLPVTEDAALLQASLDARISPRAALGLSYQGAVASGSANHTLRISLSVGF